MLITITITIKIRHNAYVIEMVIVTITYLCFHLADFFLVILASFKTYSKSVKIAHGNLNMGQNPKINKFLDFVGFGFGTNVIHG